MVAKKKTQSTKIVKCPKCDCAGSVKKSIAKGFKKCVECKFVIVSKRKVKRIQTKAFGIGQKSLDEAIKKLAELKKGVPEGATAKIQSESSYYNNGYKLIVEREETDDDVYERMLKAEAAQAKRDEKKKKEDELRAERAKKQEKQNARQRKIKELKKVQENKNREKLLEEKKKLEVFLKSNGLSIDALKEVVNA